MRISNLAIIMIKNIFLDGLVLAILFLLTMNSFSNKKAGENVMEKSGIVGVGPFVVLELFTSQGCSSCPSADELLTKTKNQYPQNVFTLSYHVDYWNYIGWEDPFSKESFTKKQSSYNRKLQSRTNYTPQIVVNGQEHFVGSNAQKMETVVNQYLTKMPNNFVDLKVVVVNNKKIFFEYGIKGNINRKKLRAVLALDKRITEVKSGENRSRTLSNSNIVISEKSFEVNDSLGSATIDLPPIVKSNEKIHLVLLLENEDNDILGVTKTEIIN